MNPESFALGPGSALAAVFTGLILGTLVVTGWNHAAASRLESATYDLVRQRQRDLVDPSLANIMKSVLRKEPQGNLYTALDAGAKLEQLNDRVLSVRNKTAWAIVLGVASASVAFVTGWLYDVGNSLYVLPLIAAAFLFYNYFLWGIYATVRIRALERINRRILDSTSVDDLRGAIADAVTILGT